MARSRVKLNSSTVQEYLDGGHGVREDLRRRAEAGASDMRSNGPVESGEYVGGIQVWEDRTDRLVVRYGSTAPHAMVVEARHGVAARSIDATR